MVPLPPGASAHFYTVYGRRFDSDGNPLDGTSTPMPHRPGGSHMDFGPDPERPSPPGVLLEFTLKKDDDGEAPASRPAAPAAVAR
jgi:hypothetical protein